jgi:hypothetical protein
LGRDDLAKAGDFTLSIEEAANLLAAVPDIPNDVGVVDAVVQFWTEYPLLAWAVNQEGAIDKLDLSPMVDRRIAETQILRLREMVIQVDTSFTDEEMRARFEVDRPGEEISARHILFAYPAGVTQPQRDSIRAAAQGVLDLVRGGGNFAALAREHSADAGSGASGGDLGTFGRGMMVPAFEEAAFALEVGAVSDLVETEYGLHIIRVDDRRLPDFEEVAESYRSQLVFETVSEAEVAYVQGVEAAANPVVAEGGVELVRQIAEDVWAPLSRADARSAIITYSGGAYTGQEFLDFLVNQGPDLHSQIVTAPADQLEPFLLELARAELLVADAEVKGITVSAEEIAQFESDFRAEYSRFAGELAIQAIAPQTGESLKQAIDREIKALMGRLIAGEAQVVPLGPLAYPLRAAYGSEISDTAMDLTVARVDELRGAAPTGAPSLPAPEESSAAPTPEAVPAPEAAPAPSAP